MEHHLHQLRHEVVGIESKLIWLPLAQQISFITFSIVELTKQYSTILLKFVLPQHWLACTMFYFFYCVIRLPSSLSHLFVNFYRSS